MTNEQLCKRLNEVYMLIDDTSGVLYQDNIKKAKNLLNKIKREVILRSSDSAKIQKPTSSTEDKLICNFEVGVENCGFQSKDIFTCKHIRQCPMCGN